MVRKFLNGRCGLGNTFWYGVFLSGIIIGWVFTGMGIAMLKAETEQAFDQFDMALGGLALFHAVFLTLILRAVIISSFWQRRFGIWGLLGITVTVCTTAMAWMDAIHHYAPSLARPLFMAHMDVMQANRILPTEIEPGVVLQDMVLNGNAMTFVYRVHNHLSEADIVALRQTLSLSNTDAQEVCRDFEGYFKGGLGYLAYSYSVQGRSVVAMMSASECLEFAKYGLSEPV